MSLVVMKFGGTSVEDPAAINRTAAIVAGRVAQGKRPVVVVSAMAKVTDQLLRAAAAAASGDRTGALAFSSRLRCRHRDAACALVNDGTDTAALQNLIDQKFDSLDEILRGLAAILELTPRISDLIVSYGERISSRIVAAAFRERRIDAVPIDARDIIVTDSQFQKAAPLDAIIATNMISVGVDVPRLGLMIVAGQPKQTAEYVQATARVGRRFPGMVITVHNWARPRDLSHFETFRHFHGTFHAHVEAPSVTPFAPGARDRALAGVVTSMIRLSDPAYNADSGAAQVTSRTAVV